MRAHDSATDSTPIAVSRRTQTPGTPTGARPGPGKVAAHRSGTLQAALGVTAFSLTFPATAGGLEGFGPWSLVAVRSVLAAVIAGGCLVAVGVPPRERSRAWRSVPLPARRHWAGLAVVAAGVVVGFPLLTTLALRTSTT